MDLDHYDTLLRRMQTMNRLIASILVPRRGGAIFQRYGAASVSVAIAAAAGLMLRRYDLPHPFSSFSFAAIAVTFWYAGTGPGLLAIALSWSVLSYFFTPLKVGDLPWDFYLIIYGVFGFLVSWFSSARIRAEKLLVEARDALEIRVTERTAELTMANQELQSTKDELSLRSLLKKISISRTRFALMPILRISSARVRSFDAF
jgi:hypothetical protein